MKDNNPYTDKPWFITCLIPRDKRSERLIRDTTGSILHGRDDRYVWDKHDKRDICRDLQRGFYNNGLFNSREVLNMNKERREVVQQLNKFLEKIENYESERDLFTLYGDIKRFKQILIQKTIDEY